MTIRFQTPLRVVSELDVRMVAALGHAVKALPLDEFIVRVELGANGQLRRILEFEWRNGPQTATLIGTNFQGSVLFVDLGPAREKGQRVLGRLVDWETETKAPLLVMRRSRRALSGWATRIAMLRRDPSAQLLKEPKP